MAQNYINEHELALMLSIGRNCKKFGEPKRACTQEAREIFDTSLSGYFEALEKANGDKRNPLVQSNFKRALEVSAFVEPSDREIARVYELLVLLSRRCLRTFGRNSPLSEDELGSLAYERWVRYRENFDPTKKSDVSGLRVNAFAYLTQVVKNIIFEQFNKLKRETSTETLPPSFLEDIEDDSLLQELEECRELILKESERCVEFDTCLRNIAAKHEIDPNIIIKTVMFYELIPQIKNNILHNKWDF